jgi:hypothetical protein
MPTNDRNDRDASSTAASSNRSRAEADQRAASSPVRQDMIDEQANRRDELSHAADYQIRPEDTRPDESDRDRTGTARRSEHTAGRDPDENNRPDAERAYRESRGE